MDHRKFGTGHISLLNFDCLATPFYGCPAKYCGGNVAAPKFVGPVWANMQSEHS